MQTDIPKSLQNSLPGGLNLSFLPPHVVQRALELAKPVNESDEPLLVETIVDALSKDKSASYKTILNSLHGRNGHSASLWKDYYLDHKKHIDSLVRAKKKRALNQPPAHRSSVCEDEVEAGRAAKKPSAAISTIKRPFVSSFRHDASGSVTTTQPNPQRQRSRSKTGTPKPKEQRVTPIAAPIPTSGSRRATLNSLTTFEPVFNQHLPAPHTEIKIPPMPSRTPSPPTRVVAAGHGNRFTKEDREFFIKYIQRRLMKDPQLSRRQLCEELAEKVPHHGINSWTSYWSNNHDLPDKILNAAANGMWPFGPKQEGQSQQGTTTGRGSPYKMPNYRESSSGGDSDTDNAYSDNYEDSDEDEGSDGNSRLRQYSASEMSEARCPYNEADMYMAAKYIAGYSGYDSAPSIERWEHFAEKGSTLNEMQNVGQSTSVAMRGIYGASLNAYKEKHNRNGFAQLRALHLANALSLCNHLTLSLSCTATIMDEEYDVIVLGTGLTECILSGLLSVEGKKVLHMDRNDYYGGDSASLNLTQLYRKFRPDQTPPSELGRDRDYAIDLVPKFIIASGELTKILVHTEVTRYLEFKQIAGSFVYRDGRISKVPSTEMEAVKSPLMGLFEKRRAKKFFEFLQNWKDDDPTTHQGINLDKDSMKTVYEKFGLESGTQDFIGHAMALYLDDDYITKPARPTYDRIILYTSSMARYGKSPYIYPLYGLGELPQSFARLSAIYGGTYMLDKAIDEIVTDADGKFVGVRSGNETVKAKQVIGDPSYFGAGKEVEGGKMRVVEEGKVVRAICLLKHPIPGTDDSDSCQIIIPQNQVNRRNDIYIAMVSSTHNVCAKDIYVAIVSTIVETSTPELEIAPGLSLLGPIYDKFVTISPLYTPTSTGKEDNIFITRSYDATSHFETVVEDVQDVWKRVTGTDLVLKKREVEVQS